MMAIKEDYEIDFDDYRSFIEVETPIFDGPKFKRMKILLQYLREKVERAREGYYA